MFYLKTISQPLLLTCRNSLTQIVQDIIDRLGPDRQTRQFRIDARRKSLVFRQADASCWPDE